jgi:hypothetical protein
MKNLVDKFIHLEQVLSREKGEFAIFALFLREDAADKWDLIVAAEWIEADRKEALAYITHRIQQFFEPDELSYLSRVVCVGESNPSVLALNHDVNINHGQVEVRDRNLFGMQIKHGYIITSQSLSADAQVPA